MEDIQAEDLTTDLPCESSSVVLEFPDEVRVPGADLAHVLQMQEALQKNLAALSEMQLATKMVVDDIRDSVHGLSWETWNE